MNGTKDQPRPIIDGLLTAAISTNPRISMSDPLGLLYAIILCALGGFIGQYVFLFFKAKLGFIWAGGVAALIGFFLMVMVAVFTQSVFDYPPIQ